MKYDYYRHKTLGFHGDYYGKIGEPVKVDPVLYQFLRITGYRVTKVIKGSRIKAVLQQSILNQGWSLDSIAAKELIAEYCK